MYVQPQLWEQTPVSVLISWRVGSVVSSGPFIYRNRGPDCHPRLVTTGYLPMGTDTTSFGAASASVRELLARSTVGVRETRNDRLVQHMGQAVCFSCPAPSHLPNTWDGIHSK